MSEGLHDWQQAFVIKNDLRERHVIAFEQAAAAIPHVILSATNSYKHAYLCAAIKAEWIESPAVSFEEVTTKENGRTVRKDRYLYDGVDIDEMHPGAVRWLGTEVISRYNEVTAVPLALS